ncbi:hypothetical protein [Vreelandella sp. EE22]
MAVQDPNQALSEAEIEQFRRYGDFYENMEAWLKVVNEGLEMGFSLEMADE